jgi:hypothetical protein
VIHTIGLDDSQQERVRRVVLGIVGRDAERLAITVTRGEGRRLSVSIEDTMPRTRASLLPEMETAQAFDDLVGVLTIALQDALG